MSRNEDQNAITYADNLLHDVIKTQPQMFSSVKLNADGGKQAGEFIAALRNQLIEMYKVVPR